MKERRPAILWYRSSVLSHTLPRTTSRELLGYQSLPVLIGLWKRASTWWKNLGRAPSRENANIIRLLLVIENKPQCQTHIMIKVISTIAPFVPKISSKICATGCPTLELTVPAKSWTEKSRARMRKKPNMEDTPIDMITPMGALQAALRVSSER